jgi:hypothetical protein
MAGKSKLRAPTDPPAPPDDVAVLAPAKQPPIYAGLNEVCFLLGKQIAEVFTEYVPTDTELRRRMVKGIEEIILGFEPEFQLMALQCIQDGAIKALGFEYELTVVAV